MWPWPVESPCQTSRRNAYLGGCRKIVATTRTVPPEEHSAVLPLLVLPHRPSAHVGELYGARKPTLSCWNP